ncbi:MAG: 50S ribosomal protein L18 [Gracilibacteraceae bacterium]|jgi:large subunit ribosomal protein L18|nr:50S ribosomal protein L18 [Gracilibacteraceae bacterium]
MIKKSDRRALRRPKHKSVRKKVSGTQSRPRLAVFRSLSHIYAQLIDDERGVTLAASSSLDSAFKEANLDGGNIAGAQKVGELIGQKALAQGITKVVYDRGGFLYHGRVAALAEGARAAGLEF